MRIFVVAIMALALGAAACSQFERKTDMQSLDRSSPVNLLAGMDAVSPALERYTNDVVLGDLWKRPQLSARDRSVVTLSVLIARNQSAELPFYLDLALDSGLKPVRFRKSSRIWRSTPVGPQRPQR
ncbi:carboxymuconolactone decarboxylase family protein [Paraburkholderia xenovorans]|uniref:carboxymuconolactone decarboxylase family protein n=1 Tax=Paraburkholderia xenovorans TaxID=36873 RepID=UPI0038BDFA86